jgi:hypothetical protein
MGGSIDNALWMAWNNGNHSSRNNSRNGIVPLEKIIEKIEAGDRVIIDARQQILPLDLGDLSTLAGYSAMQRFRNISEHELMNLECSKYPLSPDKFRINGSQFNIKVQPRVSPQKLMAKAVEHEYTPDLTIPLNYQVIPKRGFHWAQPGGQHAMIGLRDLLRGWNLASFLLNEHASVQAKYSNPRSGFWIVMPSTTHDLYNGPSDNQAHQIRMTNFSLMPLTEESYTHWNYLDGDASSKDMAKNVGRYVMPELRLDHRFIAASILRSAFSDCNRERYGLYGPVADYPMPEVALNVAIPPSPELVGFYLKVINNVRIRDSKGNVVQPTISHVDALLSYRMFQLQIMDCPPLLVDDQLNRLPFVVNTFVTEQQKYVPGLENNRFGR